MMTTVKKKEKKSRYRSVNGKHLIEVRVRSAQQLFDARDPAPFRARDLDDDFAEYIITSTEEIPHKIPVKVAIYVTEPQSTDLDKDSILEAIHSHLSYQIELKQLQLSKIFKTGQLFLMIGLASLIICLTGANALEKFVSNDAVRILKEGLIIFGWVSMWRPFELILFDWYPVFDRIRILRKVLESEKDVIYDTKIPS
jgi:hypothetical protein